MAMLHAARSPDAESFCKTFFLQNAHSFRLQGARHSRLTAPRGCLLSTWKAVCGAPSREQRGHCGLRRPARTRGAGAAAAQPGGGRGRGREARSPRRRRSPGVGARSAACCAATAAAGAVTAPGPRDASPRTGRPCPLRPRAPALLPPGDKPRCLRT